MSEQCPKTQEQVPQPVPMLPESLPACMGGWCKLREHCQRYGAPTDFDPVERLCLPGADGVVDGYPARTHRPIGTWERMSAPTLFKPANHFDALQ